MTQNCSAEGSDSRMDLNQVPRSSGHQYPATHNNGHLHQGNNYGGLNYYGDVSHFYTIESHQQTSQKKFDDCRQKLFLTDPIVDRETLTSKKSQRTKGTCEWIRDNGTYKSWLRGDLQRFWVSGGPGKGKTILSIFLTEELERRTQITENEQLLFYFCSYESKKRSSSIAVLASLVHQLLTNSPHLFHYISSYFESTEKAKMTMASPDALWIIFSTLLQASTGTVFCVLDGLDECDKKSASLLLGKFRRYFSTGRSSEENGTFRLAIFSRRIAGLDAFPQVRLDSDNDKNVACDIQKFISTNIQALEEIQGFGKIRKQVEETLLERSQGTFLWVGFVVSELLEKTTCTEVMHTLRNLPFGLPALYGRMLLQIEGNRRPIVSKIICWVTIAVRPLTLQELAAAIPFQPTESLSDDQLILDHVVLSGNILKVHKQHVSLVHESARDYLLRERFDSNPILEQFRIKAETAHFELAAICLDCIEKSSIRYKSLSSDEFRHESPLLRYAVPCWLEHAKLSSWDTVEDWNLQRPFFQDPPRMWRDSQTSSSLQDPFIRDNWCRSNFGWDFIVSRVPLLHFACSFGIEPLVRKLITRKAKWFGYSQLVNQKDNMRGLTPLFYAASRGQEAIVKLLIDKGADINAKSRLHVSALMGAASGGDESIVRLLLDRGADVKGDKGVLTRAAETGNESIVKLLLDRGADVKGDKHVLRTAAETGNESVVKLLLDRGAHVRSDDCSLEFAALQGHESIVKLLLDRGADIKSDGFRFGLTLIYAIEKGHGSIVKLLLDRGGDVNIYRFALSSAAERGHEHIVKLLLDSGADVKCDKFALHRAVAKGHESIVKLLLERGANINVTSDSGETALSLASSRGEQAMITLLLNSGAKR